MAILEAILRLLWYLQYHHWSYDL